MLTLFDDVPTPLLYSMQIWSILSGLMPTEVYLVLPVCVAVAVIWWYDTLVSDRAVEALYSAGHSPLGVALPAIVTAILAAALGLYISNVAAPNGMKRLQDLIYQFEHSLSPNVLEPNKFYGLDHDRRLISFERRIDDSTISNVFLREIVNGGDERIIIAAAGQFFQTDQESYLYLSDGVIQTVERGDTKPAIMNFNRIWISTGLRGTALPRRNWHNVYELGPLAFLEEFKDLKKDPTRTERWASEALKRFGAPILTIAYVLLGLGLLLPELGICRDAWWRVHALCGLVVFNHAAIMLTADGATTIDARIAWIIAFVMVVEIIAGIVLVSFSTFKTAPRSAPQHKPITELPDGPQWVATGNV
jgi:lipopolysaccharide export system permease protein